MKIEIVLKKNCRIDGMIRSGQKDVIKVLVPNVILAQLNSALPNER